MARVSPRPPDSAKVRRASGYLHGFSFHEQDRLYRQARFLEPRVFRHVDFSAQHEILEVGSGVGAQTEILLKRFPQLKIRCLDASPTQVARARKRLAGPIRQGRVTIDLGDAARLPFGSRSFDGAFICWFLEHVKDPQKILKEVRRVLKPRSPVFCNEVFDASLFLSPACPHTLRYWNAHLQHHQALGGDPYVGARLGNLLRASGYRGIETQGEVHHYDGRAPKDRAAFLTYWKDLLLSAAPGLLAARKTDAKTVAGMTREFARLHRLPDSVIFYCHFFAKARK